MVAHLHYNEIIAKKAVSRGLSSSDRFSRKEIVKILEPPKCRVRGTPKKPEKAQESIYPGQTLTFMFKSVESIVI